MERLREEGFEHLAEARNIYSHIDDQRGHGNVHVTRGYLYLDNGDLDRAATEGKLAHNLRIARKDDVLQARSRVLQSNKENQKTPKDFNSALILGNSGGNSTTVPRAKWRRLLRLSDVTSLFEDRCFEHKDWAGPKM